MTIFNRSASSRRGAAAKMYKSKLEEKKNRIGYVFVLPFIIGLVCIFLPTLVDSIIYAFSKVTLSLSAVNTENVGFANFIKAFTVDTDFRVLLLSAIQGMLLDILVITIFSFFIAALLNQKFIGRSIARTIFFLPVLLATGIVAAADTNSLMMSVYGSATNDSSTISSAFTSNGFSVLFSLEDLLQSTNLNQGAIQVIMGAVDNTYNIVNSSGVQILVFLSALQSISPSVFESARIEGATKWEEFWKITFPMITPMILVNVIYTVVDAFTNPKYQILEYIQEQAFSENEMGFASALSWIYFVIILVLLGIITGVLSRRIHYLD